MSEQVTETLEYGVRDWGGDIGIDRSWTCVADVVMALHGLGYKVAPGEVLRRKVTLTTAFGPWEQATPAPQARAGESEGGA